MIACLVCLVDLADGDYHSACLHMLFGVRRVPAIDLELAKLHTYGLAMVGHTTLSGTQRKISLSLSVDRATLQLDVEGGRYILKPQASAFPHLPENEHVVMRIATLVGIETPPNGLVRLKDGSLAYITTRFDRTDAGRKLAQEDFCQLAEKPPKDRYAGSAELLARLVARYASAPPIEMLRLFRLVVFAWWPGNGDLHLKNVSLVTEDGVHRLSPAYDLLCTRLVIAGDPLALPVGGRRDSLTRANWLAFATYARLPPRVAERVLAETCAALGPALGLVERSLLPAEMRASLAELLQERTATLRA